MKNFIALALMLSLGLSSVAFARDEGNDDRTVKDHQSKEERLEMMVEQWAEVDVACVRAAVAVREEAAAKAFSDFSASMNVAFSARASALDAAWSLTDREAVWEAVGNAWKTFKIAKRMAKRAYQKAVREAWRAFKDSRVECNLSFDLEARGVDNVL